jgi:hypothetical protein
LSKFIFALLLFLSALSTPSAAKQLYRDLKGIPAITYAAYSEQDSDRCRIESEDLDVALQFVANQSMKLKLIPWREQHARVQGTRGRQRHSGKNPGRDEQRQIHRLHLVDRDGQRMYGFNPGLVASVHRRQVERNLRDSTDASPYPSLHHRNLVEQ